MGYENYVKLLRSNAINKKVFYVVGIYQMLMQLWMLQNKMVQ